MRKNTQQQQPHKKIYNFLKNFSNSILKFLNVIININRDRNSVGGIHQSDRQNELTLFSLFKSPNSTKNILLSTSDRYKNRILFNFSTNI